MMNPHFISYRTALAAKGIKPIPPYDDLRVRKRKPGTHEIVNRQSKIVGEP